MTVGSVGSVTVVVIVVFNGDDDDDDDDGDSSDSTTVISCPRADAEKNAEISRKMNVIDNDNDNDNVNGKNPFILSLNFYLHVDLERMLQMLQMIQVRG